MTAPGPAAPLSLDPHKFLVPLDYEAEKTTVKYAFTARCPPSARQSEEIHREIAERVASQLTSHKYLALLLRQQAAPGRGCIYAQATAELWSPVLKVGSRLFSLSRFFQVVGDVGSNSPHRLVW